jgi:hypothetical protein
MSVYLQEEWHKPKHQIAVTKIYWFQSDELSDIWERITHHWIVISAFFYEVKFLQMES